MLGRFSAIVFESGSVRAGEVSGLALPALRRPAPENGSADKSGRPATAVSIDSAAPRRIITPSHGPPPTSSPRSRSPPCSRAGLLMVRVGCDIGGTFTDFVVLDEASGEIFVEK